MEEKPLHFTIEIHTQDRDSAEQKRVHLISALEKKIAYDRFTLVEGGEPIKFSSPVNVSIAMEDTKTINCGYGYNKSGARDPFTLVNNGSHQFVRIYSTAHKDIGHLLDFIRRVCICDVHLIIMDEVYFDNDKGFLE